MKSHEYTFDVKLFATVRVQANGQGMAKTIARGYLENAVLANEGEEPAVLETTLSLDDGEVVELIEIDGEEADNLHPEPESSSL